MRTALLTEALEREREKVKMLERSCGPISKAEIEAWRSRCLSTQIGLLTAQNAATAQIQSLHKERIKTLTDCATSQLRQYEFGVTVCFGAVFAESAVLEAQLDATAKSPERIGGLREAIVRETLLLQKAQELFKKGREIQANVLRAQSLFLATKVRLLRECSGGKDAAAEIRKLQEERGETLTRLVALDEAHYRAGEIDCMAVIGSETDLLNSRLDVADKAQERIVVLTEALHRATALLRIAGNRFQAGKGGTDDLYRCELLVLDAKIRLLEERNLQKPSAK